MGAKTRLIYDNLWRKSTMGTVAAAPFVSSEDPQHPATDTQIDTLSMYWKASSDEQTVTIPIDQGAAPGAIDFVAILGHNIEAAGVTIWIEGDDADTFASDAGDPQISYSIVYNATNIFQFLTAFTKQFVRVRLYRDAAVFPTLPQIATILCGSYLEFNRRFAPEYEIGEEDFSEMEYSDSQVLFSQERETLNVRRSTYQALNNASASGILAMFEEVKTIKAFAVCLDHTAANTNTLWVRNLELNPPVCRNGVWYWEMAIMEII